MPYTACAAKNYTISCKKIQHAAKIAIIISINWKNSVGCENRYL